MKASTADSIPDQSSSFVDSMNFSDKQAEAMRSESSSIQEESSSDLQSRTNTEETEDNPQKA